MSKPLTIDGYDDAYTQECERALVNLLHGFGPWKDSVYLVGGLTPRYLVTARPPAAFVVGGGWAKGAALGTRQGRDAPAPPFSGLSLRVC